MTETLCTQISSICAEELFKELLIFKKNIDFLNSDTLLVITVTHIYMADEIETNVVTSH